MGDDDSKELWEIAFARPLGAPRKFNSPEELRKACAAYFNWSTKTPLKTHDGKKYDRVMSQRAMCLHIGCTPQCWAQWRSDRKDLFEVIAAAEEVIFQQKFEGATAGFFNANIISRDLGLADKQEVSNTSTIQVIQNFDTGASE